MTRKLIYKLFKNRRHVDHVTWTGRNADLDVYACNMKWDVNEFSLRCCSDTISVSPHLLQRQACHQSYRPSLIHDATMCCRVMSIMFLLRSLSNANYVMWMDERSLHIWCLAVLHIIIFVHLCVFAHHFDCVDLEEIICIALIFVISLDGIGAWVSRSRCLFAHCWVQYETEIKCMRLWNHCKELVKKKCGSPKTRVDIPEDELNAFSL